ncbi:MAG: response regulator [Cyclobacteriaceae bacterium]|nr:response regulator [Cyclobacteriaceae bacterium]
MIVDDEKDICRLICGIVIQHGFDCELIYTMEMAKKYIAQESFDMYFIDVNLPDGSGFDLVSEFISKENRNDVVMISALDGEDEIHKSKSLGVHMFLRKPFSKNEILTAINGKNNK